MWFLDREVEEGSWNHSVFAKNSERVLSREVAVLFFRAVYDQSREAGWASDDHFSADGTLIEAWASMKSFVRKIGGDAAKVDKARMMIRAIQRLISKGKLTATTPTRARPIRRRCSTVRGAERRRV
jgi:hypothetical protein